MEPALRWTRIDDDGERCRRIERAATRVATLRGRAQERSIDVTDTADGRIWLLILGNREIMELWILKDGDGVVLASIDVHDAAFATGKVAWAQRRRRHGEHNCRFWRLTRSAATRALAASTSARVTSPPRRCGQRR
ncbi:hypothetical protein [Paramicrobacterium agarici]|uniref:hypothetical protein n=1 Tax=Paramicrobacterium agarici TaxID=630514 RepID=UPI00114E7EB4|nr:hypothetical protein [Microbacterium agarici]TQO21287.1 hypothetical protein FB385_0084 [Microbacterium agarici]